MADGTYRPTTNCRDGRHTGIMSRLRRDGEIIYYDLWRNITSSDLRSVDGFVPILLTDLAQIGLGASDIKRFLWVFDLKPEGISADDIKHVYQWFINQGLTSDRFRVAFSCVEEVELLPYPAVCLPDRLIYNGNWLMHLQHYHIDWPNLPMTHRLVCLMRRPSIGRAHLAKRLLAKFQTDEMIMSFGVNGTDASDDIKRLIWPRPFPMIVDRPMADQVFQHRIDHDFFYRAPVNVVVESSSQIDPNTWRSIFITEKTFKAMAWYQFPIWYAVPGLVNEVRKLGFDVFDELLQGHDYDQINDPWVRMTQVVQLTRRFCDQDPVALRKSHWSRLQKNAELVEKIHNEAITRHTQALDRLINYV